MKRNENTLSGDTERAILEAAQREFILRGYDGAKTMTIAQNAGVTHAMLHYYFGTKLRLFDRIFNEQVDHIVAIIGAVIVHPDTTPREKICGVVDSLFDYLVANPGIPRFVINELANNSERRLLLERKLRVAMSLALPRFQREWDEMILSEGMAQVSMMDFIIDVVSLNLFVFVALPLLDSLAVKYYGSVEAFLEARKRENLTIIMQRLKKE